MVRPSELKKDYYSTGDVGRYLGINPKTPYFWCRRNEIEYARAEPDGKYTVPRKELLRLLEKHHLLAEAIPGKDIIYARVSSYGQAKSKDLDRQIALDLLLASAYSLHDPQVIQDIGSGLNTKRKGLLRMADMAREGKIERIFVSHKDRLTRFGFDYLVWFFSSCKAEIIVLEQDDSKTPQQELVDDLLSLIASFSGRLYGMRAKDKKQIRKKIDEIEEAEE